MVKIRLTQDCEHGEAGTVLEVDLDRLRAFIEEGRCELEVTRIDGIDCADVTFHAPPENPPFPEEPEDEPEPEPEKPKAPKGRAKKGHRR